MKALSLAGLALSMLSAVSIAHADEVSKVIVKYADLDLTNSAPPLSTNGSLKRHAPHARRSTPPIIPCV